RAASATRAFSHAGRRRAEDRNSGSHPRALRIGDLGHGAPEEDGGEIRYPADVAEWLQDQPGRLPATRRAAIDADVSRAPQKLGLGPRLRSDCRREWKCHVSP